MSILRSSLKGSLPAILIGVGATLAAPIVIAAFAATGKPILKAAIKGYLHVADKVKESFDDAREQMSDLVAEARSEYVTEAHHPVAAAVPPVAAPVASMMADAQAAIKSKTA